MGAACITSQAKAAREQWPSRFKNCGSKKGRPEKVEQRYYISSSELTSEKVIEATRATGT